MPSSQAITHDIVLVYEIERLHTLYIYDANETIVTCHNYACQCMLYVMFVGLLYFLYVISF